LATAVVELGKLGDQPGKLTDQATAGALPSTCDKKTLAAFLHMTTQTVDGWVAAGELPPPSRLGVKRIWLAETVIRHLEARRQEACAG
jgi:hypothetical protein